MYLFKVLPTPSQRTFFHGYSVLVFFCRQIRHKSVFRNVKTMVIKCYLFIKQLGRFCFCCALYFGCEMRFCTDSRGMGRWA